MNIYPYFTKSAPATSFFDFSEKTMKEDEPFAAGDLSIMTKALIAPHGWSMAQISHYVKDNSEVDCRALILDLCADLSQKAMEKVFFEADSDAAEIFANELAFLLFSGKFYLLDDVYEKRAAQLYIKDLPHKDDKDWVGLLSRISEGDDIRLVFDEAAMVNHQTPRGVLDLSGFMTTKGLDFKALAAAAQIATLALNCKTHKDSPKISLGFTNLALVLMAEGLAYKSRAAQDFAAKIACILEKESAVIADKIGGDAHISIDMKGVEPALFAAPTIAPLETILTHHHIAGAAMAKSILPIVPQALAKCGYTYRQIEAMITYVIGHGSLENAPLMNHAHLWELGFTPKEIDALEMALEDATEVGSSFNQWVLGTDFCQNILGFSKENLDDFTFDMPKALGFEKEEVDAASLWHCGRGQLSGAPSLKLKDKNIFDCAANLGIEAEFSMRQALSPYLSGGIIDALSVPYSYDVTALDRLIRAAKNKGLKVISFYKEGHDMGDKTQNEAANKADIEIIESQNGHIQKITIKAKLSEGISQKEALEFLSEALAEMSHK